jgi:hypothetical protein
MRIGMMAERCKLQIRGITNDIPLHECPRDHAGLPVAGFQSVGVGEPENEQKTGFVRYRSFHRRSELRLINFFGEQLP